MVHPKILVAQGLQRRASSDKLMLHQIGSEPLFWRKQETLFWERRCLSWLVRPYEQQMSKAERTDIHRNNCADFAIGMEIFTLLQAKQKIMQSN
jgi:hypothetical protein